MRKSARYHYRLEESREILLIGDDVYECDINAEFDPDGIRMGARRLMSREHWDGYERDSINDGTLLLEGTTRRLNPDRPQREFRQDKCFPYWYENPWGYFYVIDISNGCNIREYLAEIKPRKDKRFDVFVKSSRFYAQHWNFVASQKVCGSIDEAKEFVESHWTGATQ